MATKFPFQGNIVRARYTDEKNSVIEVVYKDHEGNKPYNIPVDPTMPSYKALMDEPGMSLEIIAENTVDWNRTQSRAFNHIIDYHVQKELPIIKEELKEKYDKILKNRLKKIKDNKIEYVENDKIPKNEILKSILENNEDEDAIIKLKLAIFDLKDVKAIKDRSKKLKIRKAKNLLDVLGGLNDLLSTKENND